MGFVIWVPKLCANTSCRCWDIWAVKSSLTLTGSQWRAARTRDNVITYLGVCKKPGSSTLQLVDITVRRITIIKPGDKSIYAILHVWEWKENLSDSPRQNIIAALVHLTTGLNPKKYFQDLQPLCFTSVDRYQRIRYSTYRSIHRLGLSLQD